MLHVKFYNILVMKKRKKFIFNYLLAISGIRWFNHNKYHFIQTDIVNKKMSVCLLPLYAKNAESI